MRRIERPVKSLRSSIGSSVYDDREAGWVRRHSNGTRRSAVQTLDSFNIRGRVVDCIGQGNSGWNRVDAVTTIAGEVVGEILHDRGVVVVVGQVLGVVRHDVKVKTRALDDVVVINVDIVVAVSARLLMPQTGGVPHLMEEGRDRARSRAHDVLFADLIVA